MSDNNTLYRMFRQMMQGYKLGKDGENLFAHAVYCLMDLSTENPFPKDSEAFDYFFRMKNYHNVWKLHSADQKINERRMINEAKSLCATNPKNPYRYDKKAADDEKILLRDNAKKEQEEAIDIQKRAELEKAEREAEVREILEEIRQEDIEHQNDMLDNRTIVEKAKAEVIKNEAEKQKKTEKQKAIEEPKKTYVFNVQDKPKEEKKGWLNKLFKR